LSHELRSALRGAADADRDARVTYAELGAFLKVANRAIPNERFRPDFLVLLKTVRTPCTVPALSALHHALFPLLSLAAT
jgi:hypothetical protein